MNKKIIFLFSFVLLFTFAYAQVSLDPIYSPERFQPSNKFHAGCENQLDLLFELSGNNIDGVNAILNYNKDDVEILKILSQSEDLEGLEYVVEEDRITFNKLKTDGFGVDKLDFQIYFGGDTTLKQTSFSFSTGSYLIDDEGNVIDINDSYYFEFDNVPECNPDIIAPSIDLIYPILNTGEYIPLDSHFVFDISDTGKGINDKSIKINIDDISYDLSNIEHEWQDSQLTIYPDIWLPLGEKINLTIDVSDKQVYGKANVTQKFYEFETSTGLYLLNDIDPVQFRKIVNKEKYYQGSIQECDLLSKLYNTKYQFDKDIVLSINKRLNCDDIKPGSGFVLNLSKDQSNGNISLFAVLGWLLFGLFVLMRLFAWLGSDHHLRHHKKDV